MRFLVTGARGQLGSACCAAIQHTGHDCRGVDLEDGDLADSDVAPALLAAIAPERVLHCAAFTAVDRAEEQREAAEAGNAIATANLAVACRDAGVALTHVSTDYVFDGTCTEGYVEGSRRQPMNWYGETKAQAEQAVEKLADRWQIVRTSWLFGHGPANFVLTIRRLLAERRELRVVDDQRGCPTYAPDLARLLVDLALADAVGTFHGTNTGVCTWYEFAREIAHLSGHDPERVVPCVTDDFPTPARRPVTSILRDTRLDGLAIPRLPDWRDALRRYLTWLDCQEENRAS